MEKKFIPNHLHFICKGSCLNPPKTEDELNNWLSSLVEKVRMKVLFGPNSVIVGEEEPGNEGITGSVILSTSHACIHFWDTENPALLQFDIYSCAPFSTEEIIEHLQEFQLTELYYIRINRNNGTEVTDQGSFKI